MIMRAGAAYALLDTHYCVVNVPNICVCVVMHEVGLSAQSSYV